MGENSPNLVTLFFSQSDHCAGVAVRTTMDATLTNQYCAVLSRLSDQVPILQKLQLCIGLQIVFGKIGSRQTVHVCIHT
jgi:hypothetical protein